MVVGHVRVSAVVFIIISFNDIITESVLIGVTALHAKVNTAITHIMCHANDILIAHQRCHTITANHRKIYHRRVLHHGADRFAFFIHYRNILRTGSKFAFILSKITEILILRQKMQEEFYQKEMLQELILE